MIAKRVVRLTAAIGVGAALTVGLTGCGFNNIPTKEANAQEKWSQVQIEYARRSDLIGNLVGTVKGAAAHEKDTLTEVVEARAKATSIQVDASTVTDPAKFQEYAAAQEKLSSSNIFGRLMVVQEQYPNLKANENFLTLQVQLEGTQNRIAVAQRDYNQAAKEYNLTLTTFPSLIWANTLQSGHKPMQYFTATETQTANPTVDFSSPSSK